MVDFFIFQQINKFAGRWEFLDALGLFFAKYLGYFLIFFLILFLLKNFKKYWPMVIQGFLAGILARLGFTELIRLFWNRPRPFIGNHINLLLNHSASSSFPSGHAAFFFALSTVVLLYNKKAYPLPKFWWGAGLFFFLASFLISISRVFVGIHWPSDILAGAVIGIFSGWLIILFSRKFSSIVRK
jgi:undecaprenyl-diphosphatase